LYWKENPIFNTDEMASSVLGANPDEVAPTNGVKTPFDGVKK
jgi:hypothetical protein